MSASTTSTCTDDDYGDDLPREQPLHTAELLQLLDAPIRRAIDQVLAHDWPSKKFPPNWLQPGHFNTMPPTEAEFTRVVNQHTRTAWTPIAAFGEPWDLAVAIGYCARVRGVSRYTALALTEIVLGKYLGVVVDRGRERHELIDAVCTGRVRAEQHASQTLDVQVTHASVKRAQHAGASWTARIYMRPVSATAATPKETSYACTVIDEHERPTAELLALLDTFGADGGPVLDLDHEHVLVLHTDNRLKGRRARAITRDDMSVTTHLLRLDGY